MIIINTKIYFCSSGIESNIQQLNLTLLLYNASKVDLINFITDIYSNTYCWMQYWLNVWH